MLDNRATTLPKLGLSGLILKPRQYLRFQLFNIFNIIKIQRKIVILIWEELFHTLYILFAYLVFILIFNLLLF